MSVTPDSLTVFGNRRGRKPRAEAPSIPTTVRLSPVESERLLLAAKANHQKASDFVRDAILTATEDCLEAPGR